MILQRWRGDRRTNRALCSKVEKRIFLDGRFKRRTLFNKVRHQLFERLWVHNRPRENMRPHRCALFNDGDFDITQRRTGSFATGNFLIVIFDETCEVQRTAQVRRTSTYKYDVKLQSFTIHQLTSNENEWPFSRRSIVVTLSLSQR